MKLGVLATDHSWHLHDLRRAARESERVEGLSFRQISDFLGSRPHALEDYDCLLTRAMPGGTLQQVVFRMDVLLMLERRGLMIVNPPRAIEMAVDKYLSLCHLQEAGIPIPPTSSSQSAAQALNDFEALGGDVVLKPLFGSMGKGLERIRSRQRAIERFQELELAGEVIYLQAFVPHRDFDLRLLVIGEQVWGMRRVNPDHWISNLAQGATGVAHVVTQSERELAIRAASAVAAKIAGVDVVIDERSDQPLVVEVNSAPSWQGISQVLELDVGRLVLDFLSTELR